MNELAALPHQPGIFFPRDPHINQGYRVFINFHPPCFFVHALVGLIRSSCQNYFGGIPIQHSLPVRTSETEGPVLPDYCFRIHRAKSAVYGDPGSGHFPDHILSPVKGNQDISRDVVRVHKLDRVRRVDLRFHDDSGTTRPVFFHSPKNIEQDQGHESGF